MQRACSRPQGTSESRVDGSSFRGELTFATASDQPRPRAVKKKSKEKRASSTSSSGSSEEETDLAAALCKKWLGSGTTLMVGQYIFDPEICQLPYWLLHSKVRIRCSLGWEGGAGHLIDSSSSGS